MLFQCVLKRPHHTLLKGLRCVHSEQIILARSKGFIQKEYFYIKRICLLLL